ncbi:hypothetical protein BGW41_000786 [Actinomortierella wolfii]|nr:hypothetical protein BGW41_000786 [Actinomortierella wolfii]
MLLLIRLAPYPFNLMNALISATHIPFFTYFTATAVSLIKLALHVYIGSTLSSLIGTPPPPPPPPTDGDGDPPVPEQPHEDGSKALKIIVMISSMIVAIGVGAYVWNIALKEIESMEQARMERRRKKRESLARQYRHQSAGDEGRGNHQDAPSLVRTVSSDIHSSTEGQSEHQHYRNTMVINSHSHQAPQSESVAEIDLTQSASHSRLELEPGEYFVGGARSSFDEEDDRDGEHDALVTGTSKSGYKAGRVGQGYYGDQFNDDEDFEGEEDSDSDSDDFLDGLDGEEGDDMADEEDEDQDLDDMERGQDDVLDLSAAYDSTYANQGQDGIVDLHDDSSWFSQPSSDAHERW